MKLELDENTINICCQAVGYNIKASKKLLKYHSSETPPTFYEALDISKQLKEKLLTANADIMINFDEFDMLHCSLYIFKRYINQLLISSNLPAQSIEEYKSKRRSINKAFRYLYALADQNKINLNDLYNGEEDSVF